MVLTVLQVFFWFLGCFFFQIHVRGVRWVVWVGWSVKEGVCFRAYILRGFQIFYLVGCLMTANFSWRQRRHFFMFCCSQVLVLVSPRWLWERCLCLLVAICTRIRRCWCIVLIFKRKIIVVDSMFYGALRCTDVGFDGVVCFYCGFIYDVCV